MHEEPLDQYNPELPSPPPELRERVLAVCRREMVGRRAREVRRRHQWRWGFAAGVVGLLLLNGVEEQRSSQRIAAMVTGNARVAQARREAPAAGSLRARVTLLATLLSDPDAL